MKKKTAKKTTPKKTTRKYMARLPKDEVEKREDWMKALFRKQPELSMPKATAQFKTQFGSKMRPQRVYALRRLVNDELKNGIPTGGKSSKPPVDGTVSAHRNPENKSASHFQLVNVPDGNEKVAADIVHSLVKEGLLAGKVNFIGKGYIVVEALA